MPLDLQSLLSRQAHVSVPIGGASIEVAYQPHLVTGETQRILAQLMANPDPDPLFRELERILIGWDLTDGGAPVPTTADGIARIGLQISLHTLQAIMRDAVDPKRVTSRPTILSPISSAGSSPTESSGAAPITTTSSPPLNGQGSPPGISEASPTPQAAPAGASGSPS